MEIEYYSVNSFTNKAFNGNPAGVCILEKAINENLMQNIAAEVKLSETAFVLKDNHNYGIRWFSPVQEVALCGHATLAVSHVLWEKGYIRQDEKIVFQSNFGDTLEVYKKGELIQMTFPQKQVKDEEMDWEILEVLKQPVKYMGSDEVRYLVEMENESEVLNAKPDLERIKATNKRLVITAPSSNPEYDFISRNFAPSVGVNEDPVTGSTHCYLAPYWAKKLGKQKLTGYQASHRPGVVVCELLENNKINLLGQAKTFLKGTINV